MTAVAGSPKEVGGSRTQKSSRERPARSIQASIRPFSIHEFVASEFKLPRGRFLFQNIQIGQSNYLSTLQAADTHGSTDAPKCVRQRGPFRTQEYLVQLALEMDLPCFLKARALVRLRVFSYCGCGHTRLASLKAYAVLGRLW